MNFSAPPRKLRLGTRGSKLAVKQSLWVADLLSSHTGADSQIVTVSTTGDESSRPIEQLGTTGVFVNALRRALIAGDVDFLVHSYKDLPTEVDPRLHIAATPSREDPRDAIVSIDSPKTLLDLEYGARVGTGSPRRASQIYAARPDLQIVGLRGNLDTRIRKLRSGELDAIVLAMAGLNRVDRRDVFFTPIPTSLVCPAPAQGALAIECRSDDEATRELLEPMDDTDTRTEVTAERSFLQTLQAGCSTPVAALGQLDQSNHILQMEGRVGSLADARVIRASERGHPQDCRGIGSRVAASLIDQGATQMLEAGPGGDHD